MKTMNLSAERQKKKLRWKKTNKLNGIKMKKKLDTSKRQTGEKYVQHTEQKRG